MSSRFRIDPDPPLAGRTAEVTYVGPATEIVWQADNEPPTRVTPGKNGKFTIKVPPGGSLMFTDNRGMPGYLHVKIANTG